MRSLIPLVTLAAAAALQAQPPAPAAAQRSPRADSLRQANRLDSEGRTSDARTLFQALIASAPDDAARAQAQRAMAMSFAFDGDCANTARLEDQVIAYWKTREQAEPQNAFYQQGEMANEAARVCIDAGDLATAERYYRLGRELGLKEPEPKKNPASLWEYRTEHALARLAARRGDRRAAERHVAKAKEWLARDTVMAAPQRRFLPYLEGYVALHLKDYATAETKLREALAAQGNQNDPFFHYLLAETFAAQGRTAEAREYYQLAYDKAGGHNPPAAFTRPNARKKLGGG
jgi:tetratricopeptide (TPR) repeat protein